MRDTRRRVCTNAHARANLMIDYEEKVNGATSSMREGVDKMRGDSPESPQFSACSFVVSRKAKRTF